MAAILSAGRQARRGWESMAGMRDDAAIHFVSFTVRFRFASHGALPSDSHGELLRDAPLSRRLPLHSFERLAELRRADVRHHVHRCFVHTHALDKLHHSVLQTHRLVEPDQRRSCCSLELAMKHSPICAGAGRHIVN